MAVIHYGQGFNSKSSDKIVALQKHPANCYDYGNEMQGHATAKQDAAQQRLYKIGEVSRLTELKPFVLRYWETEFPMLEPVKSPRGYRLYRQEDVDMVRKIKRLLYDEGFTIAGARRHLRENGGNGMDRGFSGAAGDRAAAPLSRKMLLDLRDSLRAFLTLLERR